MKRALKTISLGMFAASLASPAALGQGTGLANYEATYRLTLGDIDYDGAIITAKGAMAMRVRRDCTKWQSHSELLFLLELDNGDRIRTHTMFRQRESLDGQNIDFVFWQDVSDSGRLEYRGAATIPANGEPGTVRYEKPKRIERKLPKGVEMPITAMREIVESLTGEGATAKHNYFDPRAKFVEIRSIGGEPIILANPPRGDGGLVDGRSWRLRATPIPEGQEEDNEKDKELKEEEEEAFTMMQVHDSGVASFMVMKAGITTIHAELVEVKQLPVIDCNRPTPPELQLSEDDCAEGMLARKEDEPTGMDKPAIAGADAGGMAPPSPAETEKAEKDCTVVVEKQEPDMMEDVNAAPVESVDEAPVGEVGDETAESAEKPVEPSEAPTEESEETAEPESEEEGTEPDEQNVEEAANPELTNASVSN